MPRNVEESYTPFRQMYFALPTDVADAFKVKCLQERKHQKQVLLELVKEYIQRPVPKKSTQVR